MNWRAIFVHLAWLAALATGVEIGTVWVCSSWVWTPLQCHYLPAYIWSSLPVIAPATTEARIIWKTGPHRKRELATNEDVVDSEAGTSGMKLSQYATKAGWTGLAEGPPQQIRTELLRPGLADLAFDGEGLWSFLLLPEVCGVVVLCYGIFGSLRMASRLMDWAAERSWETQRSSWEPPLWNPFDTFVEMAQNSRSRIDALHKRTKHCMGTRRVAPSANLAQTEPSIRPQSFPFPLLGLYNGTSNGYLWTERDAIE